MTQIPTQFVSQDMFPGAFIESSWTMIEAQKAAPFYAVRMLAGSKIIRSPRGNRSYIGMIFDGMEYILHVDNFSKVQVIARHILETCLNPKNVGPEKLRHSPDLILQALEHGMHVSKEIYDVPPEKSKMLWMVPDQGPCGHYRSVLPSQYMGSNFQEYFHAQSIEFANLSAINWYDVFMIHRSPPVAMFAVFQQLASSNRTIVYEVDDDLFSIPEYNSNFSSMQQNETLERATASAQMADVIIVSTDHLELKFDPEKVMVGPNLIDLNEFKPTEGKQRRLNNKYAGVHPQRVGNGFEFIKNDGTKIEVDQDEYDPIRILWSGSNTHDDDCSIMVEAISKAIKVYGIAIRFYFMGYCPPFFMHAVTEPGNMNPQFVVKDEYIPYIESLPAVRYKHYPGSLRNIDPDFILAPLISNDFNLAKSNIRILESGAMAVPAIASDFGPYSFLTNEMNGLKVSDNSDDWYKAISLLIEDGPFRSELGVGIFRTVTEEHSWQNPSSNIAKWQNIFMRIHEVSQKKKHGCNEQLNKLNTA